MDYDRNNSTHRKYILASQKIKSQVAFICILVLGIVLFYNICIPFDMGKMENFILFFPERLTMSVGMYVVERIVLTVFVLMLYTVW